MTNDPFLRDLEVEVDADLQLNAAGTPADDDPGSPNDWLVDPVEAQQEAVELRNLRGAIDALESGPGQGSTLSSG